MIGERDKIYKLLRNEDVAATLKDLFLGSAKFKPPVDARQKEEYFMREQNFINHRARLFIIQSLEEDYPLSNLQQLIEKCEIDSIIAPYDNWLTLDNTFFNYHEPYRVPPPSNHPPNQSNFAISKPQNQDPSKRVVDGAILERKPANQTAPQTAGLYNQATGGKAGVQPSLATIQEERRPKLNFFDRLREMIDNPERRILYYQQLKNMLNPRQK